MIELRWVKRTEPVFNNPQLIQTVKVLQYRELLSDKEKLGIQTPEDAELIEKYLQWKDVPEVEE